MSATSPRFVVLGGPVPEPLRADLHGAIELFEGGELVDPTTDGVLVHAHADIFPALRRFRDGGGRLPIYGLSAHPVEIADRIRWIREGADDLLEIGAASVALLRKLRTEAWRPAPPPPGGPALPAGTRVDRWLAAMHRYLPVREKLIHALGESGRGSYLDCAFLRDQLVRTGDPEGMADVFGQRRGGEREPLSWTVRVLGGAMQGGDLLNIGAEGACLAFPAAPGPGERLSVRIEGATLTATMEFEVRGQRRVSRDRWQVGAFALACTLPRDA